MKAAASYDTIVVGLGAMGSATLYRLAAVLSPHQVFKKHTRLTPSDFCSRVEAHSSADASQHA